MKTKLGHQAPCGSRQTRFSSIEISGDLHYCASHDFVYDNEEESRKLHDGLPCYYTDDRFYDGPHNYYKNAHLFWQRFHPISLKACIRRTMKCRGIPAGTIVNFNTSWHYTDKKVDTSYHFKARKDNPFDVKYEVTAQEFSTNFNTCEFSEKLTDALRDYGFLVSVRNNSNFIMGMVKTAAAHNGRSSDLDDAEPGEIAVAYGYGKKIGFSSRDNDFMGYIDGRDNILYDFFGHFDKWSRCCQIKKTATVEAIVERLTEDKPPEETS